MSTGRYLTVDELISLHSEEDLLRLAGIGGFNSSTGRELDRPRLQSQINRAASLIDGYVLKPFPALGNLAMDAVPDSLKGAASDLVIYWLRDRVGDKGAVDDVVSSRYREVMRWLEAVRDGKIDLGPSIPGLQQDQASGDSILGSFPESRAASVLEGY